MKLTMAQFAQQCTFIANNAADWAGLILELDELLNERARAETVFKFTDEMRMHLDHLDRKAGRHSGKEGGE